MNEQIGMRIQKRREALGLSLADVAEEIAVAVSTVQRYEKGKIESIKMPVLNAIARALRVDAAWLLGERDDMGDYPCDTDFFPPRATTDTVTFPVIGEVAAGYEHLAQEVWGGETVEIPASFLRGHAPSDYFVLSVHGDSMYPMYLDGDKVLVLKTDEPDRSGQVALILYNNEEATLKQIEYREGENWLRLVPVNPEYKPRLIEGAALEECRILGVPRLLIREITG